MKTLIVDGAYVVHAAYHAQGKNLTNGSCYIALKMIQAVVKSVGADRVCVSFEGGNKERRKIDPEYKQNRSVPETSPELDKALKHLLPGGADDEFLDEVDEETARLAEVAAKRRELEQIWHQIALLEQFCKDAGIATFRIVDYEGDDTVAVLCDSLEGEKVLLSKDSDLFQLLRDSVKIYDWDTKELRDVFWFETKYGCQVADWVCVKSLTGDTSDNIPGLAGCGLKTAVKFVNFELRPAKYKKIAEFTKTPRFADNVGLIRLPFFGARVAFRNQYPLVEINLWHQVRNSPQWSETASKIGFNSLT